MGDFGRAVRRLRRERGMTQAELADRLGLGRTSVTNLEKGQQNPPLSLLPELAAALGVDPLHLLALAVGVGEVPDLSNLAAKVRDEDLRRWASRVIGDPMTSDSAGGHSPGSQRRRSS
jgi:transcriptional regulator with XRE-family HTH domain